MSRILRAVCILFLLAVTCAAQQAPQKKRVAVLDFDYGTVRSYVTAIWGTDQDVGKGVADLLVQKLVQDGKYRVIERKQLDKILAEQNFSNSDRADPATAAKIGRVLGVDAIIVGSITKFGRDDKSTTVGGGGFGLNKFGLGGVQKRDAKAVCGITARLVDTSTAEILAAVTGNGESKRGGASLVGAGGGGGGAGAGAFDMSSKNFGETILGEAVNQAVTSTGDQLDAAAGNLPTHKAEVNALVADVSGNTLILNVGSRSGLQVGDKLEISRAVRTVKDPATGKIIKTVTSKIGDATVTEIDVNSATVTFTGTGPVKVGDVAKTPGSN
ncbi:MAG TPA: CsgG/HfaB family protein [Candidatus Angelobacter sp.]|nr:CsgG/HfaB family protein [Candidatus Angelobacter sp.]